MSKAVMFITFKLAKGASVPEFLRASEKLNDVHMSKQKGYISWKQLREGELWADLITWETAEDAQKILEPREPSEEMAAFYSFLDGDSCKVQLFTEEKSY